MQKAVIVSISITSVGVILVLLGSILGWVFLPNFIESTIKKVTVINQIQNVQMHKI